MGKMTMFEEVLRLWAEEEVPLLPPADEMTIRNRLYSTGKRFAEDLVGLYRMTGGMVLMDSRLMLLWPIDEVAKENAGDGSPDIAFADFLCDSFCFRARYEDADRSSVYGGYDGERLADSLEEFFAIYLSNPSKLDLMD